ncbi:TPA: hypothetical protein KDZ08_004792 [Vibrio parahaemolyticus]|uniref:hypothetical protein n=1 Tax=Vibrio TaxID=662 RepID=UPI001B813EBF|nr:MULTISPECIES: hypothetical protein [Vibrio]BDP38532.1 hypothetical protein VA208B3_49030 [Vibrio alginolyticus]MCR9820072.1 hypothetical protein [Vibrio parahaemolyticus]BDP33578.1 hypothetical protein VV208B2_46580 [Vibrio vulnificus]HBC3540178.1 hypothetical protein [Vibrio parahaemolyticus]HBC3592891.1 hypothetical protein [Vibrio parahaemolyticus]
MRHFNLNYLILPIAVVLSTPSYSANKGSLTLPSDLYLKDTNGHAVGYFKSDVLKTSQENIATGVHDFEIRLPDDAAFSIRADGKVIKPGGTLPMSKDLNNGVLQFEIAPLRKQDIGKVEYEVYIPTLYSIDDRFWEVFDPTYTPWVDSGQNVDFENWLPPLAQQMTDFTQTRKYKDVYTRERQDRDKDTNVGEIRNHGDPVTEYDYRAASESRYVKASVDAYVNTGDLHDCGEWVPPASETYEGLTVDQTYTCQQDQTRTWTYKVGENVIGSHAQTQSIDDIKYRTVPGTKNPWLRTASVFGSWTNIDSPYEYTSWEPPIIAQTANFDQSRSYRQNQTRTEQKQEKNAVTGEIRNVGDLQNITRAVTVNQTRTIAVSVSGWSNSGGVYSCSSWSSSTGSVASGTGFTQTRSCKQMQVRTWYYKDGSTVVTTRPENRAVNTSQSRGATGTKVVYGRWVGQGTVDTQVPDPGGFMKVLSGYSDRELSSGCKLKNGVPQCLYQAGAQCIIGSDGYQAIFAPGINYYAVAVYKCK